MHNKYRFISVMTLTLIGFITTQCSTTEPLDATESGSQIALLERQLNATFYKHDIELNAPNGTGKIKLRLASLDEELLNRTLEENSITIFTRTVEELKEQSKSMPKQEQAPKNDVQNEEPIFEDYHSIIVTEFIEKDLGDEAVAYGIEVKPKATHATDGNTLGRTMRNPFWWSMYSGTWPESWRSYNYTGAYLYLKFYRKFNTSDATWGNTWFTDVIESGNMDSDNCDGPYMIRVNVELDQDNVGGGFILQWYDIEDNIWYEKGPYPEF